MLTRLRLLKGATALLYIGPLLAGVSGMGWGLVAPFVGIFVVWLMVLRPEQWPATANEWLTAPAWGAALTQVLSQILLVTVLLALGRGVGAVAGFLPMIDPMFPLAISFLAIPFCRMLWDADEAAEQGIFLDEEAKAAHFPRAASDAAKAVVPLLNLADTAADNEVHPLLERVMDVPRPDLRFSALTAALAQPDRSHAALRHALILWASEPERVATGLVPQGMAMAFAIVQRDEALLPIYLPRGQALIAAFPHRVGDFPAPQRLRALAAESGVQGDLLAFAEAIEAALAPQRPAPDTPTGKPSSTFAV